ncbi:GNAT family N-acetyltransferase [Gracilibacillus caseinilyticus]|uniref:GNAT family N-acetyltransferase n=1 Tax=Gracilibacillus caseinilyticus TaxID=2932256 RepID=A0ABY4EX51_9BACI|nr:GNAT family protein [Gracilibacillus caseinilyticus]UOQ48996.1 GNAT family N-acetyltransferase [Gracilibacillus caseinilyticus]
MKMKIKKLENAAPSIVEAFNRWENDARLIPLVRRNRNETELNKRERVTITELEKRLQHQNIYLIYLNDKLVGEINYSVDPKHLYKKEQGTAWLGITIGESEARGKGIGYHAISRLENEIKRHGLTRVELGVFAFNKQAMKLYKKLGYKEIGFIENFTFWKGEMWRDIRMEKYINH